jgi:glycine/D-amino acid oxidase-like deaminating enzyme
LECRVIAIDVLIVGGGLQGLLLLDEFATSGRSCVLVTHSELGHGQTLHSHGLLNTGFGFAGVALRTARDQMVVPFLQARGIQPYGDWFLLTPDALEVGERASAENLPAGFDAGGTHVRRLYELNFPRRGLIERLGRDHLNRIVRGRIVGVHGAGTIETVLVELEMSRANLLFAPAVVIAATGTGTKRFLGSLAVGATQISKIRHRRVHIICVKGPLGVLPEASLLSLTHGLNIVAHANREGVTWYSTPFHDEDPNFDEAPDDAQADIDLDVVGDGLERLQRLFPPIATRDELRFTAYAGFRQDVGEIVGTPACELVDGTTNLLMALPSLAINAWSNARIAAEIVDAVSPRKVHQPDVPSAGVGVDVGRLREDRIGARWSTWRQMLA